MKTPDSGPHGLAADRDDNIWFTANYRGYIGRLDPGTGKITEFPMPDPVARDPHSLVFDQKGILWFTVQAGNLAGRLDPQTGVIRLLLSLTVSSRPYGIAVNSRGVPFFCEFGTNKLARINPETLQITEYLLPKGARPRRLAIAPGDMVYYSSPGGLWADWIREPVRWKSGRLRAVRGPNLSAWRQHRTVRSGLVSQE